MQNSITRQVSRARRDGYSIAEYIADPVFFLELYRRYRERLYRAESSFTGSGSATLFKHRRFRLELIGHRLPSGEAKVFIRVWRGGE